MEPSRQRRVTHHPSPRLVPSGPGTPDDLGNQGEGACMAKIKIGVQIRPQHTSWEAYRQAWLWADEAGVDVIYNWDHFFPLSGDPNGDHFEAWTLIAALGAQTKQATVSCLVHCMGYRNPALMSNMAKTMDHITNGRFMLGM